jgi:hypothetical protein
VVEFPVVGRNARLPAATPSTTNKLMSNGIVARLIIAFMTYLRATMA